MQHTKFDECLEEVLRHEGGFVNHPADRGGPTKFGITQRTLADWRGTTVTEEDVRALTKEEARLIYLGRFWNVIRGDDLPYGVDLALFDFAVHSGVSRAVATLQRIVRTDVDGVVGRKTLAAVHGMSPVCVVEELCARRLEFLRNRVNWETFRSGWQIRVRAIRAVALKRAIAGMPLREVVRTGTAKASSVVAGVVTGSAIVLQELGAVVPVDARAALVALAVLVVLAVWRWRARL